MKKTLLAAAFAFAAFHGPALAGNYVLQCSGHTTFNNEPVRFVIEFTSSNEATVTAENGYVSTYSVVTTPSGYTLNDKNGELGYAINRQTGRYMAAFNTDNGVCARGTVAAPRL